MIHVFLVLMFFFVIWYKDPFHRTWICISNKSNQQQFFIAFTLIKHNTGPISMREIAQLLWSFFVKPLLLFILPISSF